jgi:hypothetical protein
METVPYSSFLNDLGRGKISEVEVSGDVIRAKLKESS